MWSQVPNEVDLAVVGGGITGAGIARDAARRGLSVALFEMDDLAYGTSSRSSKLILIGEDGLITIAGGKLTTYRKMAEEVVDTAVRLLRLSGQLSGELHAANTDAVPLPGAVGWPEDDDHGKVAKNVAEVARGRLSESTCMHLVNAYGRRAIWIAERCTANPSLCELLIEGRPEILAQVDFAVDEELAATVSDFI